MTTVWIIALLIFMIFAHLVDDYYLQGWLASAKQKKWWEKMLQINYVKENIKDENGGTDESRRN